MIQHPGGPRLLLEPLQLLAIVRGEVGQHLDRHVALQPGVLGAIDDAHAALADHAGDAVGTEHRLWLEDHAEMIRDSAEPGAPHPSRRTVRRRRPARTAWVPIPSS